MNGLKIGTFDIEANGLLDELDTIWCATVKDHSNEENTVFNPDNIHSLPAFLESFDCLYGHGCIAYDFPALRKVFGWEYKGEIRDTLIMSRTQRPNRRVPKGCRKDVGPHSVEALAVRFGLDRKIQHEDWSEFSPEMLERNISDCNIQYEIHKKLLEEAEGEGWELAHRLNNKLFYWLQRQEEYGWNFDREFAKHSISVLNRWMERIDKAVQPHLPIVLEIKESKTDEGYSHVKKPFKANGDYSQITKKYFESGNPHFVCGPFSRVHLRRVDLDSNLEVKRFLLDSGWLPDEWNTNDRGERTSPKLSKNDHFRGIQGSLGKLISKRVQCKQRKSVIEGLIGNIREDGRVTPKVGGIATTGRLRHSIIVNIPSVDSGAFFGAWMRRMFIPSNGMVMVGVDSKGNQIRQLAARMGDEEFTKAVLHGTREEGTDLHSLNQKKSGVGTRTEAKNFFYGLIFGASDWKIGQIIKKGKKEGAILRNNYINSLPGLKRLIDEETQRWRQTAQKWWNKKYNRMEYKNGYIKGLDGRPILVDSEHKILVFLLQSDEAIQMAAAYVWFHAQMEKRGFVYGRDWGALIWYHDEYQVEVIPKIVEETKQIMEESIAWAGRFYKIGVPHEGEAKAGYSWKETH